jgi:MFS family permease
VPTADQVPLRAVFRHPGYRRLWSARTLSQWGDVAQFTTLALLVFHLTGSGIAISSVVVAEIAPVLLLAPLAGPLVDRLRRIRVMIGADLVRMVLAGVLAVWHTHLGVVYAVAFGLSAGGVFFNPAAGSLLPGLVSESQLVAANSGIWSAAVLSQIALAPAAGLIVTVVGYTPGFALNAASFAASALILSRLKASDPRAPVGPANLYRQGREALAILGRDRLLRALALAQALAALSAGATSALLVVLARRRLHTAGTGYGLMLGAIALGAFVGPLVLTRFGRRARAPALLFGAFGLRGVIDLVLATVTALPGALGALAGYGIGTSIGNVTFSSLIQSQVPSALRGRVFAAFDLIWQAMRLASLLGGGLLADAFGIRVVYYAGGLLLLAAALAGTTALGHSAASRPSPPP